MVRLRDIGDDIDPSDLVQRCSSESRYPFSLLTAIETSHSPFIVKSLYGPVPRMSPEPRPNQPAGVIEQVDAPIQAQPLQLEKNSESMTETSKAVQEPSSSDEPREAVPAREINENTDINTLTDEEIRRLNEQFEQDATRVQDDRVR